MATVRRTEGMEVPTGGKRSTWFCDVCKAETSTGTWKAHDGTEGHWCYACDQKGRKSTLRTILVDDTRFERGTVEAVFSGRLAPEIARWEPIGPRGKYPGEPRTCSAHGDFEPCQECKRIRDRREP